ncbi:SAM-dependent methyltransferase [Agrobacterium vitis]|uniref:Eco57I restriction-modification methylase domain-containing protein n=1 Tax=Agrobacterium vitis TaxID=373 RepID=UPI0015DD50C4|nr:Eco57I restriction-modification methylase domain-containing protein [Agrobacterium vitis]BCH63830.1 SAM-dependent methyltransferase [Agrobacterium vitis]
MQALAWVALHAHFSTAGEGNFLFENVIAEAYEIDPRLSGHLEQHLTEYTTQMAFEAKIFCGDFIEANVPRSIARKSTFTHAILNPPYKKISTGSQHRMDLSRAGLETVNLYTGFVALALDLMAQGGMLVAIIPRSFCNGPYYRPFRDWLFERAAIKRMHLFSSRNSAFKDDKVLQENVTIVLERGGQQGAVEVSTSTDDTFTDLLLTQHDFSKIVHPGDPERFIHIPTSDELDPLDLPGLTHSIASLGLTVSTGPVVDFRMRDHARKMPEDGAVPLLYPAHLTGYGLRWPIEDIKKFNAIVEDDDSRKWLILNGWYPVIRRFSSKEERRRIVAGVIDPRTLKGFSRIGLENHVNYIHEKKQPLSEDLAKGLAVFLNTSAADASFRRFNGHTQVNAGDLKNMKYPSREVLCALGRWVMRLGDIPDQQMIDRAFEEAIQ